MIVLPKAAIMTDGHGSFVWTVQNGTLRKKPVVRARALETGAEIKGLDDGEVVVVAPTPELRVGQTVTVAGATVR
jgi:multidrug efflux pump subunit AcrA (membrane-fusion protein)